MGNMVAPDVDQEDVDLWDAYLVQKSRRLNHCIAAVLDRENQALSDTVAAIGSKFNQEEEEEAERKVAKSATTKGKKKNTFRVSFGSHEKMIDVIRKLDAADAQAGLPKNRFRLTKMMLLDAFREVGDGFDELTSTEPCLPTSFIAILARPWRPCGAPRWRTRWVKSGSEEGNGWG